MIHNAIAPPTAIRRLTTVFIVGLLAMMACETSEETMGPENNGPLPVAAAGPDMTVSANVPVVLDGSGSSDPDGGVLSYQWSFTARPSGSAAALDDATSERPSFIPDLTGEYRVELVVSNDAGDGQPDDVSITAEDNTATATVGAAGGDVVSKDGKFTVTLPAGALAQDTEIGLTRVLPDQYPAALADLPDDAGLYAVATDGAEVSPPVTIRVRLPDPVENEEGQIQASVWLLARLVEAGELPSASHAVGAPLAGVGDYTAVDPLDEHVMRILEQDSWEAEAKMLSEFLSPKHTFLAFARLLVGTGDEQLRFTADVPEEVQDPDSMPTRTALRIPTGKEGMFEQLIQNGDLTLSQENESDGAIEFLGGFNGSFTLDAAGYGSDNWMGCADHGTHDYGAALLAEIRNTQESSPFGIGVPFVQLFQMAYVIKYSSEVRCILAWQAFANVFGKAIEAFYGLAPSGYAFGFEEGVINTTHTGMETGRAIGLPPGVNAWGAIGFDIDHDGEDDGVLANTSDEIYHAWGLTGTTTLERWNVPGNLGRGTDAWRISASFVFPAGPAGSAASLAGSPQDAPHDAVFVMFDERNLLFARAEGGDVILDPALADAFVTDGQSVFGTARPVSAYVSPNGFTPNDPMLVVTIPDDQDSNGHVVKLDLVNGKAVPTEVLEVTGLPRRVRCIETGSYICAVSSVGIPPFGFGSMTFFTWDGQDGVSPINGRLNPAIGIDLIQDGDRVLVASALGSEYYIDELTTGGAYVDVQSFPVPEGCTGAAHVLFRSTRDVVISCNTSGTAVGAVFDEVP